MHTCVKCEEAGIRINTSKTENNGILPSGEERNVAPGGGVYVPWDLNHDWWKNKV